MNNDLPDYIAKTVLRDAIWSLMRRVPWPITLALAIGAAAFLAIHNHA